MQRYRVHLGYTQTGRNRWRYFDTEQAAVAHADSIFRQTGCVVAVERTPDPDHVRDAKGYADTNQGCGYWEWHNRTWDEQRRAGHI